jgi:LuxR family maltose regulon positive regulatory protein
LDEYVSKINRKNVRLDILAILALVYNAKGNEPTAFDKLLRALELGSFGRAIRNFVDLGEQMANLLKRFKSQTCAGDQAGYIDQILGAFPKAQTPRTSVLHLQLADPITERELEVLVLLAQRLSNKEIAAKLVISPRTVKRHTLNIYQKLGVNSRLQAVDKASELGILA